MNIYNITYILGPGKSYRVCVWEGDTMDTHIEEGEVLSRSQVFDRPPDNSF